MSIGDAAEQYFRNMNPIASRMYSDFQETRNAYECIWDTLSYEEQSQILNECIIKPEVTLQYSLKANQFSEKQASDSFACKQIIDEHISYRDEHSAPFSFKTSSQIDLRLFDGAQNKKIHVTPKLEPPKKQQIKPTTPVVEAPIRYKTENSLFGKLLGRKHSPDAEQEVLVSPENISQVTSTSTLPKTGLDFLDNW